MIAKDLSINVPCVVSDRVSTDQVTDRFEGGFTPVIKIKSPIGESTICELEKVLEGDSNFCFGIGVLGGNEETDRRIDIITRMRDEFQERCSLVIEAEMGSAVGQKNREYGGIISCISHEQYEEVWNRNLEAADKINQTLKKLGFSLSIENNPRPTYASLSNVNGSRTDFHVNPRQQGRWSPFPEFEGKFFADSLEIKMLLEQLQGAGLSLDMEHLVETCQFGNIFNLQENAGILYFRDLSGLQKESLRSYGLQFQDGDELFDYSGLTDSEAGFLGRFGFIIRKDQPLVYKRKLTFRKELGILMAAKIRINSVIPGFQVYQTLVDRRNGRDIRIIGSHLPGITKQYIHDSDLRERLSKEIRPIHALSWDLICEKEVNNLGIEPGIDDEQEVLFSGKGWRKQMIETISQMRENLYCPQQSPGFKEKPFYF